MYSILSKKFDSLDYFIEICKSILLFILLSISISYTFIGVGIFCLITNICILSPFPYWFIGFGIFVILLSISGILIFLVIIIKEIIYIKEFQMYHNFNIFGISNINCI